MSSEFRIISIGTLPAHPLWNESVPLRTGHATTTLIRSGNENILVDPSLPAPALLARLSERTNVKVDEISQVFLTSFKPEIRRALAVFEDAQWLLSESEHESAGQALLVQLDEAEDAEDEELVKLIEAEQAVLHQCGIAPDSLAAGVDLFPLPGVTAGLCGLLLPMPSMTVLICGDAIATAEHLEQGKVLAHCVSLEQAQESFREAIQIADVFVPGRDNQLLNPARRLM